MLALATGQTLLSEPPAEEAERDATGLDSS
jgi:hypothetical protein